MAGDKPILNKSNVFAQKTEYTVSRTIFYGEVVSITDDTDGGRIKVRIPEYDNKISDDNLPWSYPMLSKVFHIFPKVGEMVRVLIEDSKYPQRGRFWEGAIISQLHKINKDYKLTALSTTDMGLTPPDTAPSTYIDAKGVFPEKNDIAIIGRVNTDIILRNNEVYLRAGKHDKNDILKLNRLNPAYLSISFDDYENDKKISNTLIVSDKIALISHDGNPKFKAVNVNATDRLNIFEKTHPLGRGDLIVEVLEVFRKVLINHIHGYSGLPADKTILIRELESINLTDILQKNITIN